jgi:hypothetical protein
MISHVRTWRVVGAQLAMAALSVVLLASLIHFPDVTHRPEPQSGKLFLAVFAFLSAAVLTLLALGVRSSSASTAVVVTSTIVVWFCGSYALIFIWINTYGT